MVWVKGRHVGLALRDEEKKRKVKKGEIREEDVYILVASSGAGAGYQSLFHKT